MGIYRLLDVLLQNDPTWKGDQSINEQKRIVIYFPPYNYEMDRSDMVRLSVHRVSEFIFYLFLFRSTSCVIRTSKMTSFVIFFLFSK